MSKVLEWSATAVTIIGALAVAFKLDPLNIYLLNFGSVLWLYWAVKTKNPGIIAVNVGLLLIYIGGLIYRLA